MLTVRAIYDGQTLKLPKNIVVKKPQEVFVTFLEDSETAENRALAEKFEALYQKWKSETGLYSGGSAIFENENYQKMIRLGKPAVPLMLKKLQKELTMLFPALVKITGENPILEKHIGYPHKMAKDWLKWGKSKGYEL